MFIRFFSVLFLSIFWLNKQTGAVSHQAECKQHLCDDSHRPYCKVDEGSALKAARSRQCLLIGLKTLLLDGAALKHKPFKIYSSNYTYFIV